MVINPEKLLRLSFPSFGHVMILLIDVAAKDKNSIGLTSLWPEWHFAADFCLPDFRATGAAALWAQPHGENRGCCQHRDIGQHGIPSAASPQHYLRPGPHCGQPCHLSQLQGGHGALSTSDITAPREAQVREHSISWRSRDAANVTEQATGEAVDSAPRVTQPGLGWVPR